MPCSRSCRLDICWLEVVESRRTFIVSACPGEAVPNGSSSSLATTTRGEYESIAPETLTKERGPNGKSSHAVLYGIPTVGSRGVSKGVSTVFRGGKESVQNGLSNRFPDDRGGVPRKVLKGFPDDSGGVSKGL
jgi:hypothetical protein